MLNSFPEMADPKWTYDMAVYPERHGLNERGKSDLLQALQRITKVSAH